MSQPAVSQQALTVRQFGASASDYLTSAVHASGADLERLVEVARRHRPARVLDLGCGAGHASYALARGGAGRVTAYDPSEHMLAVVREEAATRGAAIDTCHGSAEALPFGTGTFDLVVTRYSAHHWDDVRGALAQCARVLAPGGTLIVIDVIAPATPLFDTVLQSIEFLRDGSHVRDYRLAEWTAMLTAAGFATPEIKSWKLPMEFESWVARIRTPAARVAALRTVFAELPREAAEYFQVSDALGFVTDSAWLETRIAG